MIIDTIRQYTPLAKRIARAYVLKLPKNVLREDLEQAAMIGLFDAARKNAQYADPAKEVPGFEYYVRQRVRGAIIDELRAQDWLPRRVRGKAAEAGVAPVVVVRFDDIGGAEGDSGDWQERYAGREPSAEDVTILKQEHAFALSAPLKERDRKVVDLIERRGMFMRDVARELRVSEPRICQIHARAIAVMRMHLTGDTALQPGRRGGMYAEQSIPKSVIRRITEWHTEREREQHEHQDDSGADRTARGGQARHPRSEPEPDRVRASGLGRAPAECAPRTVPGRGGGAGLGGAVARPRAARLRAHAVTQAVPNWQPEPERREPARGGLAMSLAMTLPVPSTLPEGGLDLNAELGRYRDWMIEQALARTGGNVSETARLLGIARTTVWRHAGAPKDRCRVVTELEQQVSAEAIRQGAAAVAPELVSAREEDPVMTQPDESPAPEPESESSPAPASEPPPSEPPPAEPAPERPLSEPPTAVHVRADVDPYRVTRAGVARLKAEGLSVKQIAGKLCVNRFLIEKLLRPIGPAKCAERRRAAR